MFGRPAPLRMKHDRGLVTTSDEAHIVSLPRIDLLWAVEKCLTIRTSVICDDPSFIPLSAVRHRAVLHRVCSLFSVHLHTGLCEYHRRRYRAQRTLIAVPSLSLPFSQLSDAADPPTSAALVL